MKENGKRIWLGLVWLAAFVLWTMLIQQIDVQEAGPQGTAVGFAAFNTWFHQLTGVHMLLYTVTDWLGLVPILICMGFGLLGFVQLVKRKSLLRVDADILLLGAYYLMVILGYLLFEMIPVNYRPVLIEGILEASYPSSTTLLVLSVMPTLVYQVNRRAAHSTVKKAATIFAMVFSAGMVIGRLISGVHWATDIMGSVFLSAGLFLIYQFLAEAVDLKKTHRKQEENNGIQ